MNTLLRLATMCAAIGIVISCGQGFVTSNPPPTQTYTFTGFVGPNIIQTNCNTSSAPFYICAKSSSTFSFGVAFISSYPAAYLQIPPQLANIIITNTPGCSNMSGSSYSCNVTLVATNVESGTVVNVPYNGSLGYQGGFTITYQ